MVALAVITRNHSVLGKVRISTIHTTRRPDVIALVSAIRPYCPFMSVTRMRNLRWIIF